MVKVEDMVDGVRTINEFVQGDYVTQQYIHDIYGLMEVTVHVDDIDPNEMIFVDRLNELIEQFSIVYDDMVGGG